MSGSQSFLCYNCHQPAVACYTTIDQDKVVHYYICGLCSAPQQIVDYQTNLVQDLKYTPSCPQCKTKWPSHTNEIELGCPQCYNIFQHRIINLLIKKQCVAPAILKMNPRPQQLHIGKSPEQSSQDRNLELAALNEALQETLHQEDYEQAASLRDKINQIKQQQSHDS